MPLCRLLDTTRECEVQAYRKGQTRIGTHHNFSKRSGSKHIENLVLLLLGEARGLREERIGEIRDLGHGWWGRKKSGASSLSLDGSLKPRTRLG